MCAEERESGDELRCRAIAAPWYGAASAPQRKSSTGECSVKFMLTWRTRPGLYKAAFKQFLDTGGPPPKGVTQVARYHVPGSVLGWHVLETNDMTALAEHVNNWGDLIDIELHAVVEDAQAGEAAGRVFSK
jgi:Protein of unknown function (DUF3303)